MSFCEKLWFTFLKLWSMLNKAVLFFSIKLNKITSSLELAVLNMTVFTPLFFNCFLSFNMKEIRLKKFF